MSKAVDFFSDIVSDLSEEAKCILWLLMPRTEHRMESETSEESAENGKLQAANVERRLIEKVKRKNRK